MTEPPLPPLGLFGGTFDPIHLGHTTTILELMSLTGFEEIHFLPAATPPHRDQPGASADDRLAMTRLATANIDGVSVDGRELRRDGPSYTVDTLEEIQQQWPGRTLCLIMGLDAALGLPDWHRWRKILELAGILVMVRPGYAVPAPFPDWWEAGQATVDGVAAGKMHLVPVTPNPISATAVRETIERGQDPAPMLHPDVWKYIRGHNLYQNSA